MLMLIQLSAATAQIRHLYVNVPAENLRLAPNGKKIGSLLEGMETVVLLEKDNWVKIQVTGWMWKPSMTTLKKSSNTGEFRALHIVVKTKVEADKILADIKSGQDFGELAKQNSISPSAAIGGDLGYFNKGDFNAQIERIIESLSIDQVSAVIETSFGFNIFKRIK